MAIELFSVSEGTGQRIILLHPIGLDGTSWAALVSRLSNSFTLVSVDLAGHGRSPTVPEGYELADYADDVAALIGADSPAIVLGLSFGGMVAQHLALRHPHLVDRLILCGCPSRFDDEFRDAIARRGSIVESGGMAAVVEVTLNRWFTAEFRGHGRVAAVERRLFTTDVSGWVRGWWAISRLDILEELSAVTIPTLLIASELDQSVPPTVMKAMAERMPNARLHVLTNAGHMMQIDSAEQLSTVVRNFLGAQSSRTANFASDRSECAD